MKMIYMGKYNPTLEKIFDGFFETETEALKYIRSTYKAGTTNFFLDFDHDTSDIYSPESNDYIEILNKLASLHNSGKMRHLKLKVHFHSNNTVDITRMKAIIEHNHKWMEEV